MSFFARFVNSLVNFEGSSRDNGLGWSTTAEEVVSGLSLSGKNFIVTGANTGIGFETARVLAKAGASTVVLACRNLDMAKDAQRRLQSALKLDGVSEEAVEVMQCDLASLQSVKEFATAFNSLSRPLHCIVCNAGVMACPYTETSDGFEMQFGTNHLGHFLLVNELLPSLKAANGARVVVVASAAHRMSPVMFDDLKGKDTWYKGAGGAWKAYGQSKTANILFAYELNRRMREAGVPITANALHPGSIQTDLQRHIYSGAAGAVLKPVFGFLSAAVLKSIPQGAATSVFCAAREEAALEGLCGRYYSDCNVAKPMAHACDPDAARWLWELSERLVRGGTAAAAAE